MAATTITDYTIVDKLIEGYVAANFTHRSTLLTSGLISTISVPNFYGQTFEYRGDVQYHTAWQTPAAATDLTINAISHKAETGVVLRRADAFGFEDAARVAAGDDNATARVGNLITDAFRYQVEDTYLTYLVPGLFNSGGPLDSDTYMVTTGAPFASANVMSARKLHGANGSDLTILLMHPDVYYNNQINLLATNLDFATIAEMQRSGITYGGMLGGAMIVLNDLVYHSGTTYHTYLTKPGALGLAMQKSFGVESYRNILTAAGTDIVKYDVYFAPHVWGTTYSGTVPTVIGGATSAALGTGSNWSVTTNVTASEIGIIAIETVEG